MPVQQELKKIVGRWTLIFTFKNENWFEPDSTPKFRKEPGEM